MKNLLLGIVVLTLGLVCAACGHPPWTIVRQATPDPFVGKNQFTALTLDFSRVQVGDRPTEAAFLADKEAKEKDDWEATKKGMNESFNTSVAEAGAGLVFAPGAPYVVKPIVSFADPGKYAYVYNRATVVNMTIQVVDASNQQVLDEIGVRAAVGASIYDPSADHRLREAAEMLGKLTARYLKSRVTSDK
jgi:hypothetical protein